MRKAVSRTKEEERSNEVYAKRQTYSARASHGRLDLSSGIPK